MLTRRLALGAIAASAVTLTLVAVQPAAEDARELAARSRTALAQIEGEIAAPGLQQPVEILRDTWGVPHIYAKTVADLFFAQGYVAAQDRLWQLDLWRRNAEGKLAEVVGPTAVRRDTFARLLRYRGDLEAEWRSYGPDARAIITAFVAGVNAQIAWVTAHPEKLPIEFQLLGAKPEPWTPEVIIGRMAGYVMTRNARSEVQRARLARDVGAARVAEFMTPDPPTPIVVPAGLDLADIVDGILDIAGDASETVRFPAERLKVGGHEAWFGVDAALGGFRADETTDERHWADNAWRNGSNNWVMAGAMTATGKPILANDPHRVIALPSLRYTTHLVGPGWNVIGAGEPALPGVAAGHNDRIAFGFTIVGMDQQDLYVERLDPAHDDHYLYRGVSEAMTIERAEIAVRGEAPRAVDLRFTRHGPVLYVDKSRGKAFVLRWVGTEPGSAGYLRSMAVDRAKDWPQFRAAVAGWKVPSENIIYADVAGNIGWIAAGAAPVRRNWNGLLPVPGDSGAYEWDGFLSIDDLPQAYNPARGYIATANHNILPPGYTKALGYEWGAPHRFNRIDEVLRNAKAAGRKLTTTDSERLQHDTTSMVARALCDALRSVARAPADADGAKALRMLLAWDHRVDQKSAAAALFELWAPRLATAATKALVPEADQRYAGASMPTERLLAAVARVSSDPRVADLLIGPALGEAWREASRQMGSDPAAWAWGAIHKSTWEHPLASTPARREVFNLPDAPRSGDGNTPMATGNGSRQTAGASFREVIDLADWDRSTVINVPGQSGQPGSRFYGNLLPLWAAEQYHPLPFSREAVAKNTAARLVLTPAAK